MNFFVTGTDTDAGKTYVTTLLTRSLRNAGFDTVAMKPISCGEPGDTLALRVAADNELAIDEVTPVSYSAPLAPIEAARLEGRTFDPSEVMGKYVRLRACHRSLLVEGVGGWLVPLTSTYSTADLAKEMGLPVLLVVRNKLGALNHTLLTLESIKAHGLTCAGIVINNHPGDTADPAAEGNRRLLAELAGVPILFEISLGQATLELAIA
ncbi:MAG: dethiobiotin synthase [Verrucomicrobia bacterium]|nr:dethiobiotin synthase [Verrucomicrobiota bacterium]